jgi:hypothetical protein
VLENQFEIKLSILGILKAPHEQPAAFALS